MNETMAAGFLPISIHALREESDLSHQPRKCCRQSISIHALREESDPSAKPVCRGCENISIHALREESDPSRTVHAPADAYFNPRSP